MRNGEGFRPRRWREEKGRDWRDGRQMEMNGARQEKGRSENPERADSDMIIASDMRPEMDTFQKVLNRLFHLALFSYCYSRHIQWPQRQLLFI